MTVDARASATTPGPQAAGRFFIMKSEVTQIPPSDFAVMSDFNNLYQSYLDARKGKRWKMAVDRKSVV